MTDAPQSVSTEIIELADLPLFWQGRANALSLLNGRRVEPDARTVGLIETYEECAKELRAALSSGAAQAEPNCGDGESHMEKISALIARLQSTLDRWGDTCVYIRRGGLSWGAVALNRQDDDRKHGVFDLQAQHDRDMLELLEQIERLKKDRDEWRQKVWDAEAKASSVPSTQKAPDL